MLHILTSLTTFSIHTLQPLKRLKTTISIMLEKDEGSPKSNILHIICEYEALYNLILKLECPRLTTSYAKRKGTLGKD